jgi:predicted ATPase
MIKRVSIENFKAIYKKADFPLQPFTVFIGNNGTGKSSVIEALRALQLATSRGLNEAFQEWGGLDKVRNYNASLQNRELNSDSSTKLFEPLSIKLSALVNNKNFDYEVKINVSRDGVYYIVEHERLICNNEDILIAYSDDSNTTGRATLYKTIFGKTSNQNYIPNRLWLGYQRSYMSDELNEFTDYIESWQFLYLNAHIMGQPIVQDRVFRIPKLSPDGTNIAEYLLWIQNEGQEYIDNLVRKMQFVLPYIRNVEPHILEETKNRALELLLHESNEKSRPLPGWLLSSGTLRILALLSMFETPEKPSVLFVDEIENGLDPRTIGLFLSEVESVLSDDSMQVIVTTHSPYFLDSIPLKNIIVAEKEDEGSIFHIPSDEDSMIVWKERFSPGKLYTMGKLTK